MSEFMKLCLKKRINIHIKFFKYKENLNYHCFGHWIELHTGALN